MEHMNPCSEQIYEEEEKIILYGIVKFCCCIKFDNFHIKLFFLLLHIFAQNMDSWYSIELPCTSSMYTAVNPMQCSYTESADQPAYQPSLVSIFFAVHSGRSRGGLFEPPFKIKPFHFHGEFSEKLGKKSKRSGTINKSNPPL